MISSSQLSFDVQNESGNSSPLTARVVGGVTVGPRFVSSWLVTPFEESARVCGICTVAHLLNMGLG